MASDGLPVALPVANAVQQSQVSVAAVPPPGGKLSPPAGGYLPAEATQAAETAPPPVRADAVRSLEAVVANVNKAFNDSGKPTQFRVDPSSGNKVIQQINPATGKVVAQFEASEFPALASGLGVPGLFVDSLV
jgi:hypothetical protein